MLYNHGKRSTSILKEEQSLPTPRGLQHGRR